MAGLFGIIDISDKHNPTFGNLFFEKESFGSLLNDSSVCDKLYTERHLGKKFESDKVFRCNDGILVAIDGVILNSRTLAERYNVNNLYDAIIYLYRDYGQSFIKELDGNFCGVLHDSNIGFCLVFNNIIGSKNVFYHICNDKLLFSSDINYIVRYMNENGMGYSFNEKAAKTMLTVGHPYLYGEATYFNEISRLLHGFYIAVNNNNPLVIQYYDYIRDPIEGRSEDEILESFDELFRQAVINAFEKDKEYSYEHIACLSAGLDCKMVTWIAHELGYSDNTTNITYGQPDFWDESVPKQIARDLENKYIYVSLANGLNSLSIDENVKSNGGSYYYLGVSQGKAAFSQINMDKFGLIHSGLFSDIVRDRFFKIDAPFDLSFMYKGCPFSVDIFSDDELMHMKDVFKTTGNYCYYMVGCNSENTQFVGLSHITEPYSPFFSKDLLEFCMRVPHEFRKDSRMYKQWIIKKYPKAASYIWDRINAPLNEKMVKIPWNNIEIPKSRLKKYLVTKIKRRLLPFVEQRYLSSMSKTGNMNPMDYWYSSSKTFKNTFDDYFNENIDRLSFNNDLYSCAKDEYENVSGKYTVMSKACVLTVLSVLKNYFNHNTCNQ